MSDVDAWSFPPGTILWKEFSWLGRKVETRMIRIGPDSQVTFATRVQPARPELMRDRRGSVSAIPWDARRSVI